MTEVSVIVINYKTPELVRTCVKSVLQTCNMDLEVIILNNGRESAENPPDVHDPRINQISSRKNLGFGAGVNLAVESASGRYIFLLNSDAYLTRDTISELVRSYQDKSRIFAIGAQIVGYQNSKGVSCGDFPTYSSIIKSHFMVFSTFRAINMIRKRFDKEIKQSVLPTSNLITVDYVSGADMLFEKERFLELEGFDEKFFLYFEETDLQLRAVSAGYRNALLLSSEVIHIGNGSELQKIRTQTNFLVSEINFLKKHQQINILKIFFLKLIAGAAFMKKNLKEYRFSELSYYLLHYIQGRYVT